MNVAKQFSGVLLERQRNEFRYGRDLFLIVQRSIKYFLYTS